MSNLVLNLAIDTSGQPYDNIYVGLISIKTDCIKKFETEFKKIFPKFYRYKEKGANRSTSELKSIISFLEERSYIKMYTICFTNSDWQDFKREYNEASYLKEKVYALLYSFLFTRVCWRFKPYNAIICEESYLDINRVIGYCNLLNNFSERNIILSKSNAKSTFIIRLADFIASSHKKVDKKFLENLNNYNIYRLKDIDYKFIKKILKK